MSLSDEEAAIVLDILRQINAELDEIAVGIDKLIKEKQDETSSDEN
jgi:hypothetical protein